MRVTSCHPSELGAAEIAKWRAFQGQNEALANPFLSPDFAIIMGRHHPQSRVAIIEDDGRIVAFFPHDLQSHGMGRGLCHGLSDNQALICTPDLQIDGQDLLRQCGLDVWEFDHLIESQVRLFAPQVVALRESPISDLTGGWDSWLAEKTADKQLKQVHQRERKLIRETGGYHFTYDSRSREELQLMMKWKSAQYLRTSRRDRFAQRWFVDALEDLFATRTESFEPRLSTLYVRDKPASFDLALRSGRMLAGWFPAYDVALAAYGLGLVHKLQLLHAAANDGIAIFDFGAGEEQHKRIFSNRSLTVASGALYRPTLRALARRVQSAPTRGLTHFVLARPALRVAARRVLSSIGAWRARLTK